VLGAGLLVSILVDLRIQLLPDRLTWPLAALGAAVSAAGLGVSPQAALWGAVAGGGALWLIATGFKLLRGVEGLGLGDVKLVAMAGLWLGWMPLPWMLLGASMAAILLHLALHGGRPGHRVAFGPALALAFLATRAFWPFALG
jgi:leader peptidase (prepilin peptidase)/N-methyltransferase